MSARNSPLADIPPFPARISESAAQTHIPDGANPTHLQPASRLRRWHVTFGNPALGTYAGSIVTLHPRRRTRRGFIAEDDNSRENSDDEFDDDDSEFSDDSFSSCSSLESLLHNNEQELERKGYGRIAVMVNVPPYQVPDGVLNLVRGLRPFIEHVRIVIGSSYLEEAEQRRRRWERRSKKENDHKRQNQQSLRRSRSQTWACEEDVDCGNVDEYMAKSFNKASICETIENGTDQSRRMPTRGSRSTSFDVAHFSYDDDCPKGENYGIDTSAAFAEEKYEDDEHDNESREKKSYHVLFVLDSEDSASSFVSDLHGRPFTSLDESETCSVYHAAHVIGEGGVSLLGPCFASSSAATQNDRTDGKISPKLPNDVVPSSKDEHQCPCVTIPFILTALLVGKTPLALFADMITQISTNHFPDAMYARLLSEIMSVLCSEQLPQAPSHLGHALQHYEETLHAYALDTETQHVDFAGGGYVHRLLQNSEDGKIVEWNTDGLGMNQLDGESLMPPLSALERPTIPTYSTSAEDDEALHRKLEGFAGQYYTLLKSQLEQQRIFYQGRLEAIRREHENSTRSERQTTTDLISALKQERNQLEQRCMTLRRKHKKVSDDAAFLENMNESLRQDKHSFRKQISEAQAELTEARQLTQQLLTPLEEKVSSLMLQLENG
ncbi:hypothetical protein ACHAWF_017010 [Thalassiosira exigua]